MKIKVLKKGFFNSILYLNMKWGLEIDWLLAIANIAKCFKNMK